MNRTLSDRVAELQSSAKRKKKWTFSLEPGRGETYAYGKPTLYAHNVYPRSSVLAGQPERVWMEQWDDWETARRELAALPKFKFEDFGENGGTSYIPTDVLTAGLPDDSD